MYCIFNAGVMLAPLLALSCGIANVVRLFAVAGEQRVVNHLLYSF